MITFRLEQDSGLSPYLQLIRQVRHGLRLGLLRKGDQLPTVKALSATLAINQNTVLKAYRELDYDGLITAQPGVGTFINVTLADVSPAAHGPLVEELTRWVATARQAGIDDEGIEALVSAILRTA